LLRRNYGESPPNSGRLEPAFCTAISVFKYFLATDDSSKKGLHNIERHYRRFFPPLKLVMVLVLAKIPWVYLLGNKRASHENSHGLG
jgi:hypothetical protein